MDDAQLVVAALEGDRGAFGAIYDRYADPIHDFCASLLRNRAEAGDALQETFLVAFEALGELSEPARLRPWLYAIAHRAILDRVSRDAGVDEGDDAGDLVWGAGPSEARLSRAELAEYVWQVAGGLDIRDRAMLDLHLRQGLEGRDLASATGVAPTQIDERLRRLEAQVDRSLGALVVARTGRRSCPELFAVLNGWDGRLTPEFRNEVNSHVNDCEVCNSRRRIAPSPLTLLAATPLAPAPAYLRSVVLGKAELEAQEREENPASGRLSASAGWTFNREGFPELGGEGPRRPTGVVPVPPRSPGFSGTRPTTVLPAAGAGVGIGAGAGRQGPAGPGGQWQGPAGPGGQWQGPAGPGGQWQGPADVTAARATAPTTYLPTVEPPTTPGDRDRRGALIGGLAGVIVLIAGVVFLLASRSNSKTPVAVGTTTSLSPTTAATDTTTTSAAFSLLPTTSIATTTTTIATVGHLVVGGPGSIALGVTTNTASVTVGNDGPAAIAFTATASGAGLSVDPASGTVASGTGEPLTVTLDRTMSPPGPYRGSIQIASAGGNKTVTVTATVDPGPVINLQMPQPITLAADNCSTTPPTTARANTSTVTVVVTSTAPPTEVVLHTQGGGGAPVSTMTPSGTVYLGTLGPFNSPGPVDWWITAIDANDVTATSAHQPLTVAVCPH
jgi:RNA polymerase sigma factor (sigma-70 family)